VQANVDALNREAQSLLASSLRLRKHLQCRVELPCCFEAHLVKLFCSVQPFEGTTSDHDFLCKGEPQAGRGQGCVTGVHVIPTVADSPSEKVQDMANAAAESGRTTAALCSVDLAAPGCCALTPHGNLPGSECQERLQEGTFKRLPEKLDVARATGEQVQGLCHVQEEMHLLATARHVFVFMHKALAAAARLSPRVGDQFLLLKPWDVVRLPGVSYPIVLAFVAAAA
jgi:hypothetical protein